MSSLKNAISTNVGGKFSCLLGGKSTGKSLVLKSINDSNVFVVNLRKNKNMLTGLIKTLQSKGFVAIQNIQQGILQATLKIIGKGTGDKVDFQQLWDDILGKPKSFELFQDIILGLVESLGTVTLIFDEANLALNIDDSTSSEYIESLKDALALFILLTKEELKVCLYLFHFNYFNYYNSNILAKRSICFK